MTHSNGKTTEKRCKKEDVECDCEVCKIVDRAVEFSIKSRAEEIVRRIMRGKMKGGFIVKND